MACSIIFARGLIFYSRGLPPVHYYFGFLMVRTVVDLSGVVDLSQVDIKNEFRLCV
jgi:hypothetical protein